MERDFLPLTAYSEEQRQAAMEKYKLLIPYLRNTQTLQSISEETAISRRTLHYWVSHYEQYGLRGLMRKKRKDSGSTKVTGQVQSEIERLILMYKNNSIRSIHRKVSQFCEINNLQKPSYSQVSVISKKLSPSLKTLIHQGKKNYQNHYDIILRREANYPNEQWQADHTLLDILVLNEKGQEERPWLTIIMDDYSRAIAGYYLTFQAPSAIQTALTLHQAIWRKQEPNWSICGIPENFYTDHGSDFTSIHMEQVAIDLKINLIFSTVGVPRGRGKIERFFLTVNQLFLQDLPGYLGNQKETHLLTFKELNDQLTDFIINGYNQRIHGTTKKEPIKDWNHSGFLPNMPENLEQLDLLLLNVAKARKVHSDGIHFQGLQYMDSNLAAYVGETVIIRYDPRDIAEIRVFYQDKYLCTAISSQISGYTIGLKEIVSARNRRRHTLENHSYSGNSVIDDVLQSKQLDEAPPKRSATKSKLKRYIND